jgi:hypothetical protein
VVLVAGPALAGGPPTGNIVATREGTTTVYRASVTDPDGDPLTYQWGAQLACGTYETFVIELIWDHPQSKCPHDQGDFHEGTVTVRISDGTGFEVFCSYSTSLAGQGDPCVLTRSPSPSPSTSGPIFGEEICDAAAGAGFFEPVQAVFQDDPTFEDRPNKQISKVSDTELRAELDMVVNKPSLLFGVNRIAGGPRPGTRDRIIFRGTTSGSVKAAVKVRFTLIESGGTETVIYTSPLLRDERIPLYGPCIEPQPWRVRLFAVQGLPVPRQGTFTFTQPGNYTIKAELLDQFDAQTGIETFVSGEAVETTGPITKLQPVVMSAGAHDRAKLQKDADQDAASFPQQITEYYPLAPGRLRMQSQPLLNLAPQVAQGAAWYDGILDAIDLRTTAPDVVVAQMNRFMATGGILSGAQRVVVYADEADFDVMGAEKAGGFASSSKVVFILSPATHTTVAHEIAHTLPALLWSVDQMESECGLNYHNKSNNVAHGVRIQPGGARKVFEGTDSIMGSSSFEEFQARLKAGIPPEWMDQCTYRNVLEALSGQIDPPVTLVQGAIGRSTTTTAGALLPAYQMDGFTDLEAGEGGNYALVVRNAGGVQLGRFPFTPDFRLRSHEQTRRLRLVSFVHQIPTLDGAARIELVGPNGVLDELVSTPSAPVVSILSPSNGASVVPSRGKVTVTWTATDADGDDVVATVLYSSDDGQTWSHRAVDTRATSLAVTLDPDSATHAIRVIASDGARSTEASIEFVTP